MHVLPSLPAGASRRRAIAWSHPLSRTARTLSSHARLLRALVVLAGRDPARFDAALAENAASVVVRGPGGTAAYPVQAWTSRFLRHLHRGHFDGACQHALPGRPVREPALHAAA